MILERNESVGGTWFEHTYPGCGCDIPTHLYSYSFARNPRWTRLFPRQHEILDYVRRTAEEYGVNPHIRFATEMEHSEWDEGAGLWRVRTSGGELTADMLVSAIGATAEPDEPDIPGLDEFAGHRFHSARWDHDHSTSKASASRCSAPGPAAAQFVPRDPADGRASDVFQRTPPWVIPHFDRPVPWVERQLYKAMPVAQDVQRNAFFALYEATGVGFRGRTGLIAPIEAIGRAHLRRQVRDPELRAKLAPHYRFGCKRPILSNTYYPALARDNVDVVTDPIAEVTKTGIVTARRSNARGRHDHHRHRLPLQPLAAGAPDRRRRRAHARRDVGPVAPRLPRLGGPRLPEHVHPARPELDRDHLGDLLARVADQLRDERARNDEATRHRADRGPPGRVRRLRRGSRSKAAKARSGPTAAARPTTSTTTAGTSRSTRASRPSSAAGPGPSTRSPTSSGPSRG